MKEKFTKGEWSVRLSNSFGIESASVYYPHGFLTSSNVIKIDESRLDGESWIGMRERTEQARRKSDQESVANMHLIAAAPDMYLALKDITELRIDDDCKINMEAIKNLLAKARGEK